MTTTIDRPPRIQPDLPEGSIEIPNPPDRRSDSRAQLIQIGLPLITIVGYVLVSALGGAGRNPWLLVPMALAVVASAVFSVYSYRRERQIYAAHAKAYADRLTDMTREMHVAHDQQRRFYSYNYPSGDEAMRIALGSGQMAGAAQLPRTEARLWERRAGDSDFGVLRLGIGALPSTVIYTLGADLPLDDPQARAAARLAADSRVVTNISVIVGLRQPAKPPSKTQEPEGRPKQDEQPQTPVAHALALAGASKAVRAAARELLAHYVVFHAPADARLFVLAGQRADWAWAADLPHCQSDELATTLCFLDAQVTQDETVQIFGDSVGSAYEQFHEGLRKLLSQRQLRLQERDESAAADSPTLPHILVVVDLLDIADEGASPLGAIESEAGISILIEQGLQLGAAIMFLVPERNKAPSGCSAVIEIEAERNSKRPALRFRYAETGINSPRYVSAVGEAISQASMAQLCRNLAALRLRPTASAGIASTVPFLDLMQWDSLSSLRGAAAQRWQGSQDPQNAGWLRVPLGMMAGNKARTLVFSAQRDGVHGLVAGSTGSGKSELLISLVCGLAVTYAPSVLNFVLVDYKGGGTFEAFRELPHCVDIITNLAGDGVTRMFTAINAELDRRQALIGASGTKSIVEYRRKGFPTPLPFLFIIIDEFAEMIADRAEYKAQLERITRIGRSLGVSLLLAAQRPSGVTDQMRSNIKFRVCLRVETPGESREMLRRADAAFLPPGIPGRGYLQVGNEEVDLVQVAYAGGLPRSSDAPPVIWPQRPSGGAYQEAPPLELYRAIIGALHELAGAQMAPAQMAPWPAALPRTLALAQALFQHSGAEGDPGASAALTRSRYFDAPDIGLLTLGMPPDPLMTLSPAITHWLNGESGWVDTPAPEHALRPVVGLIDDPYAARQRPLSIDLARGHAVIFGASGYGKTTFLRTLALSLAASHAPGRAHIYAIDLGGRNLELLKALPHVGDVISPTDASFEERVAHLLRLLSEQMDSRKASFSDAHSEDLPQYNQSHPAAPLPAIVVLIDNFVEFMATFHEPDDGAESLVERLVAIARQSRQYGIHFVLSAGRLSDLPTTIFSLCIERFTLRLVEPSEYRMILGSQADELPDLAGRGYTRVEQRPLSFQVALPLDRAAAASDGAEQEQRDLQQIGERMRREIARRNAERAQLDLQPIALPQPIPALPTVVLLRQIAAPGEERGASALEADLAQRTLESWAASRSPASAASLRVTIGKTPGDRLRELCFDAKHDGVHGMVAGGTGSGKSELLMSLIVGLALRYDPSVLNFVLVDYKGGGAFEPFRQLPHCVDLVTNLNKSAVRRMFTAIGAELDRRQQINAEQSASDLIDLRRKSQPDAPLLYPHLFIIIDEYAEMISNNPEFRDELDRITRVGRSVGVNLLLAAQRPTGVTDQMRANIKLRICLRVESPDISRELLRRSDAAYLPNSMPGRGYIQVGSDAIELMQVAFAGDTIAGGLDGESAAPRFYELAVALAQRLYAAQQQPRPSAPWPPVLPPAPTFADTLPERFISKDDRELLTLGQAHALSLNPFVAGWSARRGWPGIDWQRHAMRAVVGLIDDPYSASYRPLTVNLARGHAVVFGAAGWGKSTFLRSLVVSLAATHTPSEFHAYLLDLGSRGLEVLGALPHVGTIITPDDRGYEERVQQLWRELDSLIAQRRELFASAHVASFYEYQQLPGHKRLPAILLVIDNITEFIETFGSLKQQNDDDSRLKDFILLARQGKTYGLHVLISTDRPNTLSSKLYTLFTERFSLRLADSADYPAVVGGQIDPIGEQVGRGATRIDRLPLSFQVALMPGSVDQAGHYQGGELALIRRLGAAMQLASQPHELPLKIDALPATVSYRAMLAQHFGLADGPASFYGQLGDAVQRQWAISRDPAAADWLQVPIGTVAGGRPRVLRFEAIADGVHGMVAGGTGSGKSELLMTLIVGLALRYDPSMLNFVLVDYKGGGAFKPFERLPHCVDITTNLDKTGVDRMFTAISAEIRRRQALNVETDTKDIVEYRRKGYHPKRGAYPHLFIIIDEYAEMIDANPEYRAALESITRVGRSVGVNLLLASQRPKGVSDQMRANIKLRLCLRVEDADTSIELLRRRDAAALPSGQPGRGYLQVGGEIVELIQVGFSGEPIAAGAPGTLRLYEAAVELASALSDGQLPEQPWPAPLPERVTLESPLSDKKHQPFVLEPAVAAWRGQRGGAWDGFSWGEQTLCPTLGLIDDPNEASQERLRLNLRHNHLAIFGDTGSGKSALLRTLMLTLAATHPPSVLHLYVLDFGGRSHSSIGKLPHVGEVLYSNDDIFEERMQRLFERLDRMVDERQLLMTSAGVDDIYAFNSRHPERAQPAVVVAIDNYAELKERYERLVEQALLPLMRRSLNAAITFLISANGPQGLGSALYALLGERLTLHQMGKDQYAEIVGNGAIEFDDLPGRGYIRRGRRPLLIQAALPLGQPDGPRQHGTEASALEQIASQMHTAAAARQDRLPERIPTLAPLLALAPLLDDEPPQGQMIARVGRLGDLAPAQINLRQLGPHMMIAGPPFSGKTTALYTLLFALASYYTPEQLGFVLLDTRQSFFDYRGQHSLREIPHVLAAESEPASMGDLIARLSGEGQALQEGRSSRAIVVLIDNFDDFSEERELAPTAQGLATLARRYGRAGLHMVIAGLLEASSGTNDLRKRVQSSGYGIGLRTSQGLEPFRLSRGPAGVQGRELPVGRGYLVRAGQATLIQVATPFLSETTPGAPPDPANLAAQIDGWVERIARQHTGSVARWAAAPSQNGHMPTEPPAMVQLRELARRALAYESDQPRGPDEYALREQLRAASERATEQAELIDALRAAHRQLYRDDNQESTFLSIFANSSTEDLSRDLTEQLAKNGK